MRSLGLFTGTFNPIHNGHLLIAECAQDQFRLDRVLFVTSAMPPHRKTGLLDAEARHDMVQAAIADNDHFISSRWELERKGPSYTIDTVRQAQEKYGPDCKINLIIGGDNVRTIREWHKSEELIAQCRFLVAPRLVYERTLVTKTSNQQEAAFLNTVDEQATSSRYDIPGAQVAVIDFPAVSISSSMVRKRLQEGRTVLYMVPKAVAGILERERHYMTS
jgi:nicotinate-nucleotide adenylyltransferase